MPKRGGMENQHPTSHRPHGADALTIEQTLTGCWTVRRGEVEVAFAMTRAAAEHERETLTRLSRCSERRAGSRAAVEA